MTSTTQHPHAKLVRRLLIGALVLAIAVAVGLGIASRLSVLALGASHIARTCVVPKGPGVPAITPTLPCQVPAFTAADVIAYYHLKNINGVYTQTQGIRPGYPPAQLVSIQFLPAAQVDAMLRETSGMPADHLLCLAWFRGKFDLKGALGIPYYPPPGPGTPNPVARLFTQSFDVYDAATGNNIWYGMRP